MKVSHSFLFILLICIGLEAICQTQTSLKIPADWTVEKFNLPPSFAPEFPYTGSEVAIFAPDWAKKKSHGYWTYCFQWTLTGYPSLDKSSLENALTIYYTNLVISNLKVSGIDPSYAIPVKVKLIDKHAKRLSYTGTVTMLDYMTQNPITLNIRVTQTASKTFFMALSPMPFTDNLWAAMNGIIN